MVVVTSGTVKKPSEAPKTEKKEEKKKPKK